MATSQTTLHVVPTPEAEALRRARDANARRQARYRAKHGSGADPKRNVIPAARLAPAFGLQRWVAIGGAVVIAVLLFLSLTHLADGVGLVTRCAEWQAVSVAIGIDANLVFAEAALLVACAEAYAAIRVYAWVTIIGTLCVSAALNSLAFCTGTDGWQFFAAIGFGCFIPAAVFVCTKIAAGLVVHR